MKTLFRLILVIAIIFIQLEGYSGDTVAVRKLLDKASVMYESDRTAAVGLFLQAFTAADSARYYTLSLAEAMERVARFEYYRGNTESAVALALKVMNYYGSLGDLRKKTDLMILVGDILRGNVLFGQSYRYLKEARRVADSLHDSLLMARVYNRLAAIAFEDSLASQDTTERYALYSLGLANLLKDSSLIYNNLNILGVMETKRGNYRKSLQYLDDAYPLVVKFFPEDEPLLLLNIARNYNFLLMPAKSEELNLKAFHLAEKYNIPQYIRLASLNLESLYLMRGDYKKAHNFMTRYYQSKERILTQKVLVQLEEFNNRLADEKQRADNQKLVFEKQISRARVNLLIILGMLLVVLLAGAVVFIVIQHRQKEKVNRIAVQLDQSNNTLRRFISILGHDLRSPFNAILGFTDILRNEPDLSAEEREIALTRLYSVSQTAFKHLEGILEWSRIQTGTIKPVFRVTDLCELVNETFQIVEPAAIMKQIGMKLERPDSATLQADYDMMLSVLRNLLSNAIKFTVKGGQVTTQVLASDQEVTVRVSDNGVGMTPEEIGKLFHPEDNYKSAGTAGETGSGLGLILCRDYIDMHGGKISVSSVKNEGSVFTVTLPVRQNKG